MKIDALAGHVKDYTQRYSQQGIEFLNTLRSRLLKKPAPQSAVVPSRLACDFGRSKILFLEIQKVPEALTLVRFQKTARQAGNGKDAEALKQFYEAGGYGTHKVRLSVKGQGVVVRFIQMPKMKPEDLKSAIGFEAEKFIPFKQTEVILDYHILDPEVPLSSGPGMNLLLVAVKRDEIYPLIQTFQAAGLEVEMIDIDALAFLNALEFFYPESMKATVGVLDIGTEISTLNIMREGKPRFIRDISYGGTDIIKRLKRKLGLTDQAALEQLEVDRAPTPEAVDVLKEGLGNLVADLKVSLDYYQDQAQQPAEPVSKLYLGGGGGYHPIVIETLTKELGITVETLDVLSKVQLGQGVDPEVIRKNQGLLPIALGLCLRDL